MVINCAHSNAATVNNEDSTGYMGGSNGSAKNHR